MNNSSRTLDVDVKSVKDQHKPVVYKKLDQLNQTDVSCKSCSKYNSAQEASGQCASRCECYQSHKNKIVWLFLMLVLIILLTSTRCKLRARHFRWNLSLQRKS